MISWRIVPAASCLLFTLLAVAQSEQCHDWDGTMHRPASRVLSPPTAPMDFG
ncbi:MAG: hypothetical protein U0V87_15800 [Acidobacteriota bacterium]